MSTVTPKSSLRPAGCCELGQRFQQPFPEPIPVLLHP
jgi:hypothetical protein